jgi:tetratricopeptide (TPR) repeat protein
MLKDNPEDILAHDYQESIYCDFEDWEKAAFHGEMARKGASDFWPDYTRLGYAYAKLGRYDKAREAVLAYVPIGGDSAEIHSYLESCYIFEGKYDEALAEAEKAIALNPTSTSKGLIWSLQGEWEKAEKECQRYLAMPEPDNQLAARYWLEILYRTEGKFRPALEQARLRFDLAKKQNSLGAMALSQMMIVYDLVQLGEFAQAQGELRSFREFVDKNASLLNTLRALNVTCVIAIAQKDLATAQRLADESRKLVSGHLTMKTQVRYADAFQGEIEIERGNYAKAVSDIEKALALWPAQAENADDQSWPVFHLGMAHFRAGNMEKARKAFEDVTKMTVGRIWLGELYPKSYYMLGQVFEKTGDRSRAIENYAKFLDLWKNADPGLPEVADAQKRLAGLKNK